MNVDQITNLLNVGLGALLPACLLGLRDIQRRFTESNSLPTWGGAILPVLMFVVAFSLALGNRAYLPAASSATGLWWVQGLLFFFALLVGDRLAMNVYVNNAASTGDVKKVTGVVALLLGLSLLASPVMADPTIQSVGGTAPPPLSFKRVSISAGGGVNLYGQDEEELLGQGHGITGVGSVAYSLGRQVSIGASYENDFDNEIAVLGAGMRLLLLGTGTGQYTQLAIGFDALQYNGEPAGYVEDDFSYGAIMAASYNIAGGPQKPVRWYITGKSTSDLKNDRTWLGLALRLVWAAPRVPAQ